MRSSTARGLLYILMFKVTPHSLCWQNHQALEKPKLSFIGLTLHICMASHELSFSSPSFSQISPGANSAPLPGHPNKVICERVRLPSLFPLLPSDQDTTIQEDAHFKAFFQVLICLPFPYTGLTATESSLFLGRFKQACECPLTFLSSGINASQRLLEGNWAFLKSLFSCTTVDYFTTQYSVFKNLSCHNHLF